jgi:Domain of unknown function (DUF4395)
MTGRARTADPYRDVDVIDSQAPRFNQAVIGSLSLLAFVVGVKWLPGVLAAQLAVGLTLGRRFCLPCAFYFEVVQPRVGEGRLEDARPPRFANVLGVVFLGGATLAFIAGATTVGWALTLLVAGLALLAASTGLCLGCEAYLWIARLRGIRVHRHPERDRVDPSDFDLRPDDGTVAVLFKSPYCLACQRWSDELSAAGAPTALVDVSQRPDLASRYAVRHTPLVLAVDAASGAVAAVHRDDPEPSALREVLRLVDRERAARV